MGLIRLILKLYIFVIIFDLIIEFFPKLKEFEPTKYVQQAASYSLNFVRKFLSRELPFFSAHLVVIVMVYVVMAIW